ncbi:hypothetical protein DRO59_08500 [Candidatus Bathyarchaeota archaeon]|nr:MAG: hypothetical protein DRO59_08500 [Candidatus Bathyarchaeota archaeon]
MVKPNKITIRQQKTKWGSCSRKMVKNSRQIFSV